MLDFEEMPKVQVSLMGTWENKKEFIFWYLENEGEIKLTFGDRSYLPNSEEKISELFQNLYKYRQKTEVPAILISIYEQMYPSHISTGSHGEVRILIDWTLKNQVAQWIKGILERGCTGLTGHVYPDEPKEKLSVKIYKAPWFN